MSHGLPVKRIPDNILSLSDNIRATIEDRGITSIGPIGLALLDDMLDRFLSEDKLTPKSVELKVIMEGRVDKLLEALREEITYIAFEPRLEEIVEKASTLEKRWLLRFGSDYDDIDSVRLAALNEVGALHHITLNEGERPCGHRFSVSKGTPVEYIEVGKYTIPRSFLG